jgi:hypothetical protein
MGNATSIIEDSYRVKKRPRPDLRRLGHRTARDLSKKADWTTDRAKVQRRLARFEQERHNSGHQLDSKAKTFALSNSYFAREHSGTDWECMAILGQGGFGIVGLWQQMNDKGEAIDVSDQIHQLMIG